MRTHKPQIKPGKLFNPETLILNEFLHSELLPFEAVIDKLLKNSFPEAYEYLGANVSGTSYPKANIYQTDGNLEMVFEIAGLGKDDIKISLTDYSTFEKVFTISGKKNTHSDSNSNKIWFLKELKHSSFERKFIINNKESNYMFDDISASFDNGVLRVVIPKYNKKMDEEQPITKYIDIK
jgi:HSP20 family molecular chaperone IbpA